MSANPHRSRRVAAIALLGLLASCGGGGGGGGSDIPAPVVTAIDPSSGFSGHQTEVVITGDNFLISATSSSIQAWLDSTALLDVTRDASDPVHKLHATVPAGMDAGPKTLKVQNAYGRTGTLASAFTVITTQGGALAVTSVQATPSEVNVGQSVTVQAVVRNAGTATVTGVVAVLPPTMSTPGGGAAGVKDGPTPASVESLAPGTSTTFSWTVEATAAGQVGTGGQPGALALPVTSSGVDAFSQELIQSAPVAGSLVIDEPAGLTATVVAGRATVDVNQPVQVTFTVTNGGTAAANLTAVTPSVSLQLAGSGSGSASCTTPSPNPSTGSPVAVGAHGTRTFTWSCTATAAGVLTLSGTAVGKDANTNANLSATPTTADTATVQTAAAMLAAVAIKGNPAAVNVGQTLTVDLTVTNTGTAPAHVTKVTPTFSPNTTSCSAASPDPPSVLAGSGTIQFSWTCTPAATGTLTLGATLAGSDDNTSAVLAATATSVSVPVQLPAALVAIPSATPNPANTGQTISVTLTVVNGGGAQVDSPAVTPVIEASSTATGTCTAASALPASIAPSGGHATSTWTCQATTDGTLQLTATVTGTDHNNPSNVLSVTPTPIPVTVQKPALVAVTSLVVDRTKVDINQGAQLTLSLRNTGGADARVTIAPTSSPAGPSCVPVPTAAQILSGGDGTLTVSWTCTSAAANTFTYGASITAVDVNQPTLVTNPAATPVTVEVQALPALSAVLSLTRNTLDTSQQVTVTLTITNSGGASASVSNVVPSATNGTGSVTCAVGPNETLPVVIPGSNGSATFTWTCTGRATAGTASLGAAVTATDVNNGGGAPAPVSALPVTVQTAAALTASLAAIPTSASVGQAVTVTLSIVNAGTGVATVSALTPSFPSMSCGAASRSVPFSAGAGTTTVTWTCSPTATPSSALGATMTAAAVNTGANVSPTVAGTTLTVAEVPLTATLTATPPNPVTAGGDIVMSLVLTNPGTATAHLATNAVTATVDDPGAAGFSCTSPTLPATLDIAPGVTAGVITWTCTAGSSGGSATLGANVTATDLVSGGPVNPVVTGQVVTVQ